MLPLFCYMDFHTFRLRLNKYVSNLDQNLEQAIIPYEHLLVDLNREQMKVRHVDANDSLLPEYSEYWKGVKGINNFNLYFTGSFQNKMFIAFKFPNEYIISSGDQKTPLIEAKVGTEVFGISPINQPTAQEISTKAIRGHMAREILDE